MRDTFEGAQHAINCSVRALCEAFYAIMDAQPEAADIRRMHGSDLDPIKEKLYEYLFGGMSGPPLYQLHHGTICMTKSHQPYAIGSHERDQWLKRMVLLWSASAPARKLRRCCKARWHALPLLCATATAARSNPRLPKPAGDPARHPA
jgi:truncated hemoglobin YjbI